MVKQFGCMKSPIGVGSLFGWNKHFHGQKHVTFEFLSGKNKQQNSTPLKTNMSLENQWLEDVYPIEIVPFKGTNSFVFGGVFLIEFQASLKKCFRSILGWLSDGFSMDMVNWALGILEASNQEVLQQNDGSDIYIYTHTVNTITTVYYIR